MGESAIAGEAHHACLGPCRLRAERERQPPAQTSEAARGDKALPGLTGGQKIGDPDRRIAGIGDHDRFGCQPRIEIGHQTFGPQGSGIHIKLGHIGGMLAPSFGDDRLDIGSACAAPR